MSALPATVPPRHSLVEKFAHRYNLEPAKLLTTLKATAFKVKNGEVTNEQMAALLVVADQHGLNPFTREIFAFPDKQNGIVPVVGVDGWSRIINEHPQSDGMEFRQSDKIETIEHAQPCPEWMECVVYRKDRTHPIVVREYLDEVYRPPFKKDDGGIIRGPWQSHTKRFLRHKTMIQAARLAYGFVGIFDEDEAERILERDVTPPAASPQAQQPKSRTAAVADRLKTSRQPIDVPPSLEQILEDIANAETKEAASETLDRARGMAEDDYATATEAFTTKFAVAL